MQLNNEHRKHYCESIATVTQTSHDVTLYVHGVSCYKTAPIMEGDVSKVT